MLDKTEAKTTPFRLEEATIDDLHAAIRPGATTCVAVVQHYLARARAYNGVASVLVTEDGAPVAEATGAVRAGAPLTFPTQTVKASTILPDLDKYQGPPLEFGRMEATASDPTVQQQFGMIVGIPNAGQLNALGTLNIRGERSVTCKGEFDRHPSLGPLPPGAPPVCEEFRQQPDALERAAELDAQYGSNPDLDKMPMYGVVFSFKDPFDTKDMRSTGGGDAAYDIDFPARDHVLVEQLRNKGAIIFAKAVNTEYNGRAGNPGGRHKPDKVLPSTLGYQRSTWAGNPSNPYDTTRAASLGSSSGSGVSVSANLVMASLGEETRASCRGPSNHNAVALILPHKAMLGFDGGAIGADIYCDRTGIHRPHDRRLRQGARRAEGPGARAITTRAIRYTTVPRSSVLARPTRATPDGRRARRAEGHAHRRHPRVDGLSRGSKTDRADRHRRRARDQDGARRASSARRWSNPADPLWTPRPRHRADDGRFPPGAGAAGAGVHAGPAVPPAGATARRCSRNSPPRSCRPSSCPARSSAPARWRRSTIASSWPRAASRRPRNLDIATIQDQELAMTLPLPHPAISDAPRRGLEGARLHRDADRFRRAQRALEILGRRPARRLQELGGGHRPAQSARRPPGRRRAHHAARAAAPRRHDGDPGEPARRAGAPAHAAAAGNDRRRARPATTSRSNLRPESLYGPNAGLTEVLIPAGYVTTVYDPVFKLSADGTRYVSQAVRHADDAPGAGPAVLAGVPRRARHARTCC